MIIRIARFHELSAVGRDWITDALKGVPGVRGAYHASPVDGSGYVSIAINDDDAAMEVGTQAIARRRLELGIDSRGPDEVAFYVVDHYVENRAAAEG